MENEKNVASVMMYTLGGNQRFKQADGKRLIHEV